MRSIISERVFFGRSVAGLFAGCWVVSCFLTGSTGMGDRAGMIFVARCGLSARKKLLRQKNIFHMYSLSTSIHFLFSLQALDSCSRFPRPSLACV